MNYTELFCTLNGIGSLRRAVPNHIIKITKSNY